MAELTQIETKIAEVIGLAQAAQGATEKVAKLVDDGEVKQTLQRMNKEAAETEERTTQVVENLDGKKTAILEKARETKQEATEMMSTYLGSDADALDGLEFLTMAEAGEVGHWQILGTMNERARNSELQQVIEWVTPIQERHFQETLQGSLKLAAEEDPNEPA
jgi:rubrerythrin